MMENMHNILREYLVVDSGPALVERRVPVLRVEGCV